MRSHTTSLPWRMPLTLCDINTPFLAFCWKIRYLSRTLANFSRLRNCIYRGLAKHAQTGRKWRKHVSGRNEVDYRGAEAQASALKCEGTCVDIQGHRRHSIEVDSGRSYACIPRRQNRED